MRQRHRLVSKSSVSFASTAAVVAVASTASAAVLIDEGFEATTLPAGWSTYVNWTRGPSTTGTTPPTSFQRTTVGAGHPFFGHNWPDNSGGFLAAPGNGSSPSEIDLWLVSPALHLNGDGAEISFWTFSMSASTATLEVRLSAGSGVVPNNGGSYDNDLPAPLTGGVGDFTNLLLHINPTRATGGYPTYDGSFTPTWTEYTATVPAGIVADDAYLAFRSNGVNLFGDPRAYKIVALDDILVNSVPAPAAIQWAVSADGNWSVGSNWVGGVVPNGTTASALLGSNGGVISGARVVTNDAPHTVGTLTLDHAAGYTVAGAQTLTINQQIKVVQGAHAISAPIVLANNTTVDVAASSSLAVSGAVTATDKTLTKTGGGSLSLPALSAGGIAVDAGSVSLTGNAQLKALSVATGATLDVRHAAVVIDYASGQSPLATHTAAIADGRIQSSTAAAGQSIGYLDTAAATSPAYAAADASTFIVALTLNGDANLDRTVGFDDLLVVAQHYASGSNLHWFDGDSTRDGLVNFDDLLALAQNYGASLLNGSVIVDTQLAGQFSSDWTLALATVPEPASLGIVAGFVGFASRRRRAAV